MIGAKVIFIHQKFADNGHFLKNEEVSGIILDKFRGAEQYENGQIIAVDYYLVDVGGGVLRKLFCDEAVRIDYTHGKTLIGEPQ
jgi:hypothetical protein